MHEHVHISVQQVAVSAQNWLSKKKTKSPEEEIFPSRTLFIPGRTKLLSIPHRESTSAVLLTHPAEQTPQPCSTKLRQESAMVATPNTTGGKLKYIYFFSFAISLSLFAFFATLRGPADLWIETLCCCSRRYCFIIQCQSLVCAQFLLFMLARLLGDSLKNKRSESRLTSNPCAVTCI